MAPTYKKRKGKEVAASPSSYSHRFRTKENEDYYNAVVVNKSIIPEVGFALKKGEFLEIQEEIARRGWELVCSPPRIVGMQRVLEFYANAWQSDKSKEREFKSFVRGKAVEFNSETVESVLNLEVNPDKSPYGFCARMKGNKKLQTVLREICLPGAEWKRDKQGRPNQLARSSLIPVARGWLEFINHSIIPTTHHSEITVDRAVMIHCLITKEQVDLGTILSRAIAKFAYSSRMTLGFPCLIQRLTEAAVVVIEDDSPIHIPKPITAAAIEKLKKKDADKAPEVPSFPPSDAPMSDMPSHSQNQTEQTELQRLRTDFDRFRLDSYDVYRYLTHAIHRIDPEKFPECQTTCRHLWQAREPNPSNEEDDDDEDEGEDGDEDEDQGGD